MPSPSSSNHRPVRASTDALRPVRSAMALWAEPVIADRVADAYAEHALSGALRSLLSIHHRRLWRALLLDEGQTAQLISRDLERDLLRAGLEPGVAEEIDALVLEELMDIVFARYRSSRDTMKACSRVLLAAAAKTSMARPLHA